MKDAREFTVKVDEDEETWEFRRPNQKTLNKADLIYRAKFSEALRMGLLLNAEAIKVLKERGLWDSAQEDEERVMRDEIASLESKLEDPTLSNKDGKDLCSNIADLRVKLSDHGSIVTSTMENTCESIANDERNQFLTAQCVHHSGGQKVYKDVDDFKSRRAEPGAIDAYREAIISSLEVVVGRELPSDLTEEYAENKWLSTRDVKNETEEDKPVKKKKARKKKTAKAE